MKHTKNTKHPKGQYIQFKRDTMVFFKTHLTLGDEFSICVFGRQMPNCRFVKATPKGFNFLNLDTDRLILTPHIYMRGMAGKEFDKKGILSGYFLVPEIFQLNFKYNRYEQIRKTK